MKKVFLAGIIQGSKQDNSINSQDYRQMIIDAFNSPPIGFEIFDPFKGHERSVDYDDEKGKDTFFGAIERIKECNLMVAFLPQASLGTAIEIWEAYKMGIPVWTISSMKTNWVIKFCSEKVFENVESLGDFLQNEDTAALKES